MKQSLPLHSIVLNDQHTSITWEFHISVVLDGLGYWLIQQQREAIASTPLDSAEQPLRLTSLGISHLRRFQRFGKVEDIDWAIEQQREAITSMPLDSVD
jgi:hypothetical protein